MFYFDSVKVVIFCEIRKNNTLFKLKKCSAKY